MDENQEQTRSRVSAKYLGKHGIHGIGSRPGGVIVVYHAGPTPEGWGQVLSQMRKDATPFVIDPVETPAAQAFPAGSQTKTN